MKKVLIAIPSQGWIHQSMVMPLIRIWNDQRYQKTFLVLPRSRCTSVEAARQSIQVQFLKSDCDYLLSMDHDNAPLKNPLDLIELGKDIIGCVTPTWNYSIVRPAVDKNTPPIRWNAFDQKWDEEIQRKRYVEHTPREGLQKVDAIGTGCFLAARRVFEAIKDIPWTSIAKDDGSIFKGEDILFSERVREKGFEIYAHFDYTCSHFNELEIGMIKEAFEHYYINR